MRLNLPLYLAAVAAAFPGCATSDSRQAGVPYAQTRKIERIVEFDHTGQDMDTILQFALIKESGPRDAPPVERELWIVVLTSNENAEAQCRRIIDDLRTSGVAEGYTRVSVASGDGTLRFADLTFELGSNGLPQTRHHCEQHPFCEFAITREDLLAGTAPVQTVRNWKSVGN